MNGTPELPGGVRAALDGLGVAYEVLACDPEFADTPAFCEKYGYPPDTAGNTILVGSRKGPKKFSACLVKASTQLDVNKTVRRLMEVSKASFASAEDTIAVTGMMIGGVTPFGLPRDLPLYVDAKVMALDYLIVGAGSRSAKIRIDPGVFLKVPNAEIVPGLSREIPAP